MNTKASFQKEKKLIKNIDKQAFFLIREVDLNFLQTSCAPSDFENKCFLLNACLLSGLFQTSKVQTKAETVE